MWGRPNSVTIIDGSAQTAADVKFGNFLTKPYHTHSVDEITAKLQGMTVFTFVDFKKSYWMVVLYPDCRKLTCMVLPFGRFQWT